PQLLSTEAEAISSAWRAALDEDIGGAAQFAKDANALGVLEGERTALLAPVDAHDMARQSVHRRVTAAGDGTVAGTFGLAASGTEVGEPAGGERSGDGLLAADHGDSGQRQALAGGPRFGCVDSRGHRPSTTSSHSRTRTSYILLLIMHYPIMRCEIACRLDTTAYERKAVRWITSRHRPSGT